MNAETLKQFTDQITKLFIEPEIQRRDFKEKVFAFLILMKDGEPTKILLNRECSFNLTIERRNDMPGDQLTPQELAGRRIASIDIPNNIFDEYAFIAAFIINKKWTLKFSFLYNKPEALELANTAKAFLEAAKSTSDPKVKSYNLFQAVELASYSYFMTRPMKQKLQGLKKHGAIQAYIKKDAQLGNFPSELRDLFNGLLQKRRSIYGKATTFHVENNHIELVGKFIEKLRDRNAHF